VQHSKTLIGAILTLAMFGAGGAIAQSQPTGAGPLARSTFIATMDAEYRKLDTNNDKIVTKAEIEVSQRRIAADAAAQRARAIFQKIDADRNGALSLDEFIRANAAPAPSGEGAAIMKRLDTDRDQKVTLVEYRVLTLKGFDSLDADKDGILTVAEQRASGLAR
jgi:Ca2+-binding EF-hand superfamily protein